MITKLNLDQFLQPFSESSKASLSLPRSVSEDDITNVIKTFLNHDNCHIKAHESRPVSALPKTMQTICVKANPIDSPFYLAFSDPTRNKLFELFFGSTDPFQDQRLSYAASGYLVTAFLSDVNQKRLFQELSFYLADIAPEPELFHHLKLEIFIEESYPILIDCFFPEKFLEAFNALYQNDLSQKKFAIELPISVTTGLVTLDKDTLDRLKKTDIVFLDESYYDIPTEKGMAKLCFQGHNFAQARISHHHLKFLEFNHITHESNMETSDDSLKPISDVSFELHVEFATFKMSLKELESLNVGQTIDLHKDKLTSCFLTLRGQKIAKGELVKVGEKTAFMIEEIHHG